MNRLLLPVIITVAVAIASLALAQPPAQEQAVLLYAGDNIDTLTYDMGRDNPNNKQELNTDPAYLSEGNSSLHISSVSPADAKGNSYLSVNIPIQPTVFKGRELTCDAWTSQPQNTQAFYVRGYDADKNCVLSWQSWSSPVQAEKTSFELIPHLSLGSLNWEDKVATGDIEAEVVMLRFYVGTHDKGVPFDVYLDNVRSLKSDRKRFADVTEPKKLYPDTALVKDGAACAIIVTPADTEYVALANDIAETIKDATGIALPVKFAKDTTDDDLGATNAIVLGNIANNLCLLYPYSHGLVFADGVYPGAGGYELRTVHDPWGTGHNIIAIGSSDLAGTQAAVELFKARITAGEDLTILPFAETKLTGAAEKRFGGIFSRDPDEKWAEGQKKASETHLQVAGTRGLFSKAGSIGRDYALTRKEPYARMFVWMIERTYENYLSDPQTYGGPWGMDSDFHIYQVIPGWDAVEECPAITDEERFEVTKILFRWVGELGPRKSAKASSKRIRFNHQTFPALGCLFAGQYFDRYYHAFEGHIWTKVADGTFGYQLNAAKAHCDCNTYQWHTLHHTLAYCLARPDLSYFESGNLRLTADYVILTMNNLGYQVPYGDVGGWGPLGGEMHTLRAAEWFYRDGRFQWAINKKMAVSNRLAVGDFDVNSQVVAEPDDLLGACVWPLDNLWYDSFIGDEEVDRDRVYDKITFRNGFDPDDQYLLLDGLARGGHCHMDGNAILQWTENGRIWLADADYIKSLPKYHNTMLILKDGQSQKIPGFCELQNIADLPTLAAARSALKNYAGVDWHRYVIWPKGRFFLVIDQMRAKEEDDYSFRAVWQTIGQVSHEDSNLDINQKGQHARFAMTADLRCILTDDPATGKNWGSYPFKTDPVVRVFQGIANTHLTPGAHANIFTALHASGEQPSEILTTRLADNAVAVTGAGEPLVAIVPDAEGRISIPNMLDAEADLIVITPERGYAIGVRQASFMGYAETFPEGADIEVNFATGEATVMTPAATTADVQQQTEILIADGLITPAQVKSAIEALISMAPPPAPPAGPAADAPDMPERWAFRDIPTSLLLTNNPGQFGRVNPGLQISVSPDPLPANIFSGEKGNNADRLTDGLETGTGNCVMWGDDQEVTINLGFDRVCDITGISLKAWFATASSKNKIFQLGRMKVLASNDDFQKDTRTLLDHEDTKMHPSWGVPVTYAFDELATRAKQLRVILAPRPGSGIYVAELQVRGNAEGLVIQQSDVAAVDTFRCVHCADLDGDGLAEVIAGSNSGHVYCFDGAGVLRWKFDCGGSVETVNTVDFAGDDKLSVIAGGIGAKLFALDADGKLIWEFAVPRYKRNAHVRTVFPADLTGDQTQVAIAGCDNWRYYAVDADGKELWHYESVHGSTAGLAADLDGDGIDEVIAGTEYYWSPCINAAGSRRWGYSTAGGPHANAAAAGDIDGDGQQEVIWGGADTLVQAAGADGKRIWQFNTGDEVRSVACVDVDGDDSDEILATSLSFNVYCLDGEGNMLWRRDLGNPVTAGVLTMVGDKPVLAAGCLDGTVYLISAADGKILASHATGAEIIALAQGKCAADAAQIIAAAANGSLYALDIP